jgi:organic radical activating enzyme
MKGENSKEFLTKEISIIFKEKKDGTLFPKDYVNNVKYWGNIKEKELHSCFKDGTAKMLTMDLDFGDSCSLRCPHCFRRDDRFDKIRLGNSLTDEEIYDYIKQAKRLGLKEIKILGRGEPFQNKKFLKFLRDMTKLNIGVAIFTKGHVLGSDTLAKAYNQDYGIETAEELVKEVKKLKVSILLGFNSFSRKIQEEYIGVDKSPIKNYVKLRDRALTLLVKHGFNEYKKGQATRLCLCAAPIKPESINDFIEIYQWGRLRNMYVLTCPTTMSGKGLDEFKRAVKIYHNRKEKKSNHEKYVEDIENLYTEIYAWAIKTNLIPLEKFKKEGVSLYPGCHPCNQTAAGFFLNLSGQVVQCPGRVTGNALFAKDIREYKNLRELWTNCLNYKRAKESKKFNFRCVARDGYSLPANFYSNIREKVLKKIKQ